MSDIKSYVDRIEKLEQEKKEIQQDIKDIYAEAKSRGYNKKALKQVIKLRKMADSDREELSYEVEKYLNECNS